MAKNITSAPKNESISGVGELFRNSWEYYKDHSLNLILLALISLLGFIPLMLVGILGSKILEQMTISNILLVIVMAILFLAVLLFGVYVAISAEAGIMVYLKTIYQKGVPKVWEAFNVARKKYIISYLGAGIVYGVLVILWSLLFIVPGIIFLVFYLFGTWVVVFKDKKALSSLEKSVELIRGYWWAVTGRLLLLYVIIYFVIFVLNAVIQHDPLAGIITQIFSFLIGPFVVFYFYIIFTDLLKIKKVK